MARAACFAAPSAGYGQFDGCLGMAPEIGRQLFRLHDRLVFGAVRPEMGERGFH
jgi:hypothetical protein